MADEKMAPSSRKRSHRWYSFLWHVANILAKWLWGVKYIHHERIDEAQAPYILIGNHTKWMDPVICSVGVRAHEVTWLAKKELLENRIGHFLLTRLGVIPVDRHHTDMSAMRSCLSALRNGEILGVFPEGTRHHGGTMMELETGVAMFALRSGAPVMPMLVADPCRLFHRTRIYCGEAIPTEDLRQEGVNAQTCEILLERIRQAYADLREEAAGEKK